MLDVIFSLIGVFGLIGICIAKIWNIATINQLYEKVFIFLGLAGALIFWVFYFVALLWSIQQVETITTPESTVYVIQGTNYLFLTYLFPLTNFLLGLVTVLTAVEVLNIFNSLLIRPKNWRK